MTQEPRPPEPEQGTVEWAEWATRISREDPDEWKRIRDRTRTEFREQGRELFGALRFVVKPIIWAIASFWWVRQKTRRVIRRGGNSQD